MKSKFYLILVLLVSAGTVVAQQYYSEASNNVEVPTDSLGVHPWNGTENDTHIVIPSQSHWSMHLGLGFNVFDGDYTSEKKSGVGVPTISLGGTYHWNNTWALGVEYKYRNYKVTGSDITIADGSRRDADVLLKGNAHQAWAFATFDVFNAFRPQNKKKVFALDFILGGGALCKKNSLFYPNTYKQQYLCDFPYTMTTATDEPQKDDKYKVCGVFVGGLSAEFNINRSFQIGLRGLYNYATNDEVDGRPSRGQNNDAFFDCELILRYKFEPRKQSNVRNFMVPQQIDNWNDGTYCEDPAMGAAKKAKYGPKPQKGDTLYNITHDTIWMAPANQGNAGMGNDFEIRNFVVFFENDVPELDNVALSITGQAAMLLNSMPNYNAVVVGSCDNTGAVEYNKWLATQRSINVTEALKGMGVDSTRIYNVGRGIMQDDREEGSYDLNRRVEIHIVTDEQMAKEKDELSFFEIYKSVKRGSAVRQPGEGKDASSSEALKTAMENMKSAAKPVVEKVEKVIDAVKQALPKEEETQEIMDKVVVSANTTLSKLAKQYYGNANLWMKIFEANRNVLESPDQLQEGVELIIPKLNK